VSGEVVREDPAPGGLQVALEFVSAATTRDELLAVWNNYAPGLSVADRARLHAAGQQAIELLEQGQEPAGATEPADPPTDANKADAALREALVEALMDLGYEDCIETRRSLAKAAIKKRIEGGELIPGARILSGDLATYTVDKALVDAAREEVA
jgi:hypothetical protein